jgi:predicted O-methyltransferase YrrM
MTDTKWQEVDAYIVDKLLPEDHVLDDVLAANAAGGLPAIDVAANQGKLLYLIALISGARRILEVGTLGGYSTIWLARALPADGRLVTLEADPLHAEVARDNLARAGLGGLVDLREGNAIETLPTVHAEKGEPFDLIFIDADKPGNPVYLDWALRLSRSGSVIIVDNVVRGGQVIDRASVDPAVQGTRKLFDLLAGNPALEATAVQTVGSKGYDGFVIARVR